MIQKIGHVTGWGSNSEEMAVVSGSVKHTRSMILDVSHCLCRWLRYTLEVHCRDVVLVKMWSWILDPGMTVCRTGYLNRILLWYRLKCIKNCKIELWSQRSHCPLRFYFSTHPFQIYLSMLSSAILFSIAMQEFPPLCNVTIGLCCDYQFGSKYYNTHEPWSLLLYRRSQSEAFIRAGANLKCFVATVAEFIPK